MVRIAVDAMGGDRGPLAIVRGAEAAVSERIAEVVLVGDESAIRPLLANPSSIEIVHTPVFVEMKESPSRALRQKKDSSVNTALGLLKAGSVQGVVSAGNSGAVMAFAIVTLGRIPGVERPAIMTRHPSAGGTSILVDAGGTVDCRPSHLIQFALMGEVFARCVLGIEKPRVGLLSNGEEETKGNDLTRETHGVLKTLDLNYLGYIEGTELSNGNADVIVTDGFVGNVALKVSEGVAEFIMDFLRKRALPETAGGGGLLQKALKDLSHVIDYSEYGGAALVGVDGVCIICHGKSDSRAIKNAVAHGAGLVGQSFNEQIKNAIGGTYAFPAMSNEQQS
jgi:glycerol-3-phosphate acyltransferase PlsX